MTRSEFTRETKLKEWQASGGCCRDCGRKLYAADRKEYDHDQPDWDGGSNKPENCRLRCGWCHDIKTHKVEAPQRAEMKHHQKIAAGVEREADHPMPFGRKSRLKKKVGGGVVDRITGEPIGRRERT